MRIATFNIWNNPTLWFERIEAICEEVKRVDPDVLALQEVRAYMEGEQGIDVAQHIANETGYPFCVFHPYPDSPDEGLAFLSKTPFDSVDAFWHHNKEESNYCAIRVNFTFEGYEFGMTNVHLNWRSSIIRDGQIKAVHAWMFEGGQEKPYEILCGDFNDNPNSSIHQFLTNRLWSDVTDSNEGSARPTLDYVHNPYLNRDATLKLESRYDWILCRNGKNMPTLHIDNVEVFGNIPVTTIKILPSDHYGVLLDVTIA